MAQVTIKTGDILQSGFWPEPVRVLTVQPMSSYVRIEAVGMRTQQFYQRLLTANDLQQVQVTADTGRDFAGEAEACFLGIGAHRIRCVRRKSCWPG